MESIMEFNQKEMNVIGYSVETALSFLEGETEEFKSEHQSLINQLQVLINKIDWWLYVGCDSWESGTTLLTPSTKPRYY